jgi:hypothetical protein
LNQVHLVGDDIACDLEPGLLKTLLEFSPPALARDNLIQNRSHLVVGFLVKFDLIVAILRLLLIENLQNKIKRAETSLSKKSKNFGDPSFKQGR